MQTDHDMLAIVFAAGVATGAVFLNAWTREFIDRQECKSDDIAQQLRQKIQKWEGKVKTNERKGG